MAHIASIYPIVSELIIDNSHRNSLAWHKKKVSVGARGMEMGMETFAGIIGHNILLNLIGESINKKKK